MIRSFLGAVMAGLAFMAGLWLMIAPFALGASSWTSATTSQFFTGLGIAVVALAGGVAFALAIRDELVGRGLVRTRKPEPAPVEKTSSSELATLLAPLVEALREDLNHRPSRQEDLNHRPTRQNGSAPLVSAEENL